MQKFCPRVACLRHKLGIYLIREHLLDAILPEFERLSHRYPHIRIEEVASLHRNLCVVCYRDGGSRRLCDSKHLVHTSFLRPALLWPGQTNVHAHFDGPDHEGISSIAADIAQEADGDLLQSSVYVFLHGKQISQCLCGVSLVREPVPYRHTRVTSQFLHVGLSETAIFNTIVHASKHTRRILHRLFIANVRAAGTDIGHMRSLIEGRYLETTAGARRIFLKDERNLSSLQPLHL